MPSPDGKSIPFFFLLRSVIRTHVKTNLFAVAALAGLVPLLLVADDGVVPMLLAVGGVVVASSFLRFSVPLSPPCPPSWSSSGAESATAEEALSCSFEGVALAPFFLLVPVVALAGSAGGAAAAELLPPSSSCWEASSAGRKAREEKGWSSSTALPAASCTLQAGWWPMVS